MTRLTEYACLGCERKFPLEITERESASSLEPDHAEQSPACALRVGTGPVRCKTCGETFALAFPHWHLRCNLAGGDCPACGTRHVSTCIC